MKPITLRSKYNFQETLKNMEEAISRANLIIVSRINAQENLRKAGFNIPGSYIFEIFRPDFAFQMFSRNLASGIDPPLRIYIFEKDNMTFVEYYRPSDVLKKWEEFDLGILLDNVFESIISEITHVE
ncbi:MAG: DUF302 domain-containing protein [Thermoplasmatales archaeon]|jgi:Uncharacterized conserved protein